MILHHDELIGVDVSPPHELNHVADYGDEMPGWRAIWHRFNPTRNKRIYRPSILLVLMRVIEFGGISYRRQKAELADIYISPSVLQFKRNDFHAAQDIAAAGYEASQARLLEWLASAPESLRSRRPDIFGAPRTVDDRGCDVHPMPDTPGAQRSRQPGSILTRNSPLLSSR